MGKPTVDLKDRLELDFEESGMPSSKMNFKLMISHCCFSEPWREMVKVF